jgi:hypothetical protein
MRWLLLLLALAACDRDPNTADDADPCGPADDVERGARTTGSAAKAGAKTAADGVVTFGESVGGFFTGGRDEAKRKWDEGGERTKATAKDGGDDTKATARTKPCEE